MKIVKNLHVVLSGAEQAHVPYIGAFILSAIQHTLITVNHSKYVCESTASWVTASP